MHENDSTFGAFGSVITIVRKGFPICFNFSAERASKIDDQEDVASEDHAAKFQWRKAAKTLSSQQQIMHNLQLSHDQLSPDDDPSPVNRFKMAAQRVQHGREADPSGSRLHDVVQMVRDANPDYDTPRTERDQANLHLPTLGRSSPSENRFTWGASDLQESLPQKLRESTDILIRKVAEIQYEESLRQSQETIREALDRVKKGSRPSRICKESGAGSQRAPLWRTRIQTHK